MVISVFDQRRRLGAFAPTEYMKVLLGFLASPMQQFLENFH